MTGRKPRHLGVQLGEAVQQLPGRLAGTNPGMACGQQVRDVLAAATRTSDQRSRPTRLHGAKIRVLTHIS